MSERIGVLAFCGLLILLSLGIPAWLFATGQALYVEGLFVILTCGVMLLICALSVRFLLKN